MKSFILAAVSLAVAAASPCASGWTFLASTNSCYKAVDGTLPWTVSEFKCLFQGAHHTSVNSLEENQFVSELVGHREMFIGAAYFGKDAQYVNSDQKPFGVFENWETGTRPSMNRARRCVKVNTEGKWFQSCCKKVAAAVCKKAASSVPAWVPPKPADEFRRRLRFRV